MILRSDIRIINQFFERLSLVKEKRETLQENQKSLAKVKKSILKKKSQVDDQKKKKTTLLKKIRDEKKTYQSAVRELEKASHELQSLIDRLQNEIAAKKKHFIPEDAKEFLADMDLEQGAKQRIIRTSFELLQLIVFFTVGDPEARAWSLKKGQKE